MSAPCEPAVLEFPCAPGAVWAFLCDAASFGKWYGFPNPRALLSVEPEFSLGAKLRFQSAAGVTIITDFRPGEAMTLTTASTNDQFTLEESERGCRVRLVTTLNGGLDWHGTAKAKSRTNKEILRALRAAVCGGQQPEPEPELPEPAAPEQERRFWHRVMAPMFYGYRTPIRLRRSTAIDNSLALSSAVDNTDGDVMIHLRALLAGMVLGAVLLCVLAVCTRFESSDIVTSSGLSVVESDKITLENAQRIYIGQSRHELELMLSCRGTRYSAAEYVYYSVQRDARGESLYEIHVTYDAYGDVRRFGFLDRTCCASVLPLEIRNYTALLNPQMTPLEAANALGAPLTAYWHDKSGATVLYFGVLDESRDLYDPTLTSELVVRLEPGAAAPVDLQFYAPYDPLSALPFGNLNKQYRRQYSNETVFRADRAAYERLFLIVGLDHRQVDALLGTELVEYAPTASAGVLCSYQTRRLFAVDPEIRYCYNVTYDFSDIAVSVSFQNGYLEAREGMLLDPASYAIYEGETLNELYSTVGQLPTFAVYDGEQLTLCFGSRAEDGRQSDPAGLYDLSVVLDAHTGAVVSHHFRNS